MNLFSFFKVRFKRVNFNNCSLQEVDFLETDLSAALFTNCDLTGAIFDNSILEKPDLGRQEILASIQKKQAA